MAAIAIVVVAALWLASLYNIVTKKTLSMLNLVIFIEAYCYSGNTAFLKRFQELCERNDLSGGILLQDCCSKSTAFLLS